MTNWKNCIINDHTGKRPPSAQNATQHKKEAQPTDFSAIAPPLSDPYRIQNIEFYEIKKYSKHNDYQRIIKVNNSK